MKIFPSLLAVTLALATGLSVPGIRAQNSASEGPAEPTDASANPFEAYRAGRYDSAVAGFRERVERRPGDPVRQLNLGSALHQASDYAAAESALERATVARDRRLQATALYNLGNNAYHQGRLEDAVQHYREALDLQPEDEDTKYNLEFVQQEMERRRQQAQDRQQNQDQQNQDQHEQDQQGQDQSSGENEQDPESQNQSQPGEGEASSGEARDSDGDGLSDQQERSAENPTNPNNPDTDGDGRSDGEEDRNRNGRVDEGETNPNVPDQPGSEESAPQDPQQGQDPQQSGQGQARPASMSPEEAARLLASLEDRRPPGARGKKVAETTRRSEKDW